MRKIIIVLSFLIVVSRIDMIFAYDWPIKEFTTQHKICATLGEYRSTSPADHFHAGVDIAAADGTFVYAIDGGTVTWGGSDENAYVKVGNKAYIHLTNRVANLSIVNAGDKIGEIYSGMGHVHLQEDIGAVNPLRIDGLSPYDDASEPVVYNMDFYPQGNSTQLNSELYGKLDIRSRAWDMQSNGNNRQVGIYKIGYQVANQNGNILLGPLYNIQFDSISGATLSVVYDMTMSDTSTYYYWVTNTMNNDRYWNTKLKSGQQWDGIDARINSESTYPDGKYKITVLAFDIKGNGGDIVNQKGAMTKEKNIDNFRPYVTGVIIGTDYYRKWVFDDTTSLLNFENIVNNPFASGTYTVTIVFSEPVSNATLSIDTIGTIALSSSDPPNNQKAFTGSLTIPPNASGDKTLTISAQDLAGNNLVPFSDPQKVQVNPLSETIAGSGFARDSNGDQVGNGGVDTLHHKNIDHISFPTVLIS